MPEFRRFIFPFLVDDNTAGELNRKGGTLAKEETTRIASAIEHIRSLKGKVVINAWSARQILCQLRT